MPNLMTFDLPFKEHLKFVRQFSSPLKKLWRNLLSSPSHIPLASGFDTLKSLAKLTVSHQSIPSSTLGSSTGPHRAIGDHTKAGIVDTYGPEETFTEGFREYHERAELAHGESAVDDDFICQFGVRDKGRNYGPVAVPLSVSLGQL
ncbi:hypothetical protein AAF712_016236 [Marasmius tenuissimus]|uniref:Uncharacterized protein n=1 Tax=Marasmius tenuissimus TaxID=585030 RepID=A0ABR2Z8E8_9AGAR